LFNASVGNRKIVKNSKADDSFYDGIEMTRLRYKFFADLNGFIPLHKKWVLALSAKLGTLMGSANLVNELFKIGGFNTLRGFNEFEINASTYAVGQFELRFIFARKSYLNAFFDIGWYEKILPENILMIPLSALDLE
jgi:outer membrane protein assembly factor BamA